MANKPAPVMELPAPTVPTVRHRQPHPSSSCDGFGTHASGCRMVFGGCGL